MIRAYAIRDGAGYIKFGITRGEPADRRMAALQTGNARALELVGYAEHQCADAFEEELHCALTYAGLHERGEWFKPSLVTTCVAMSIASGELDHAMQLALDAAYDSRKDRGSRPAPAAGASRWMREMDRKWGEP